ncbi:MAG: beta-N-acetylhexosaminidase [Alphaproteobacteria bacterium]|nr:beta-N-acetylhexosaminidase [Alphaproteobacteria bacterium]
MRDHMVQERPLPLACVFSVEGKSLTHAEKSLFSAAQPFGFILFGRNCESRDQVRRLTNELRSIVGWHCPIMIDQEGGRVARLRAPDWPEFPSAKTYGDQIGGRDESEDESLAASVSGLDNLRRDMIHLAHMLIDVGIDSNCAPVCDVLFPETHQVIGDRAYSSNPEIVAIAAAEVCRTFLDSGLQPIMKHLPGHGRAMADSHHHLPVVNTSIEDLQKTDFLPFRELSKASFSSQIWGMVAHIIYTEIDPDFPATLSSKVINDIIRKEIGFKGLLFSDDLDMKALEKYGTIPERANLCLQAGCDIALYCWAKLDIMEQLAAELPPLSAKSWARWNFARS